MTPEEWYKEFYEIFQMKSEPDAIYDNLCATVLKNSIRKWLSLARQEERQELKEKVVGLPWFQRELNISETGTGETVAMLIAKDVFELLSPQAPKQS